MTNQESLSLVPLFAGLTERDIAALAEQTRKKLYPAKQQILWSGEEGETLYIIVSGRVKVHCATESGSELTLAIMGPGEFFGELSLLDHSPRSADITAVEKTECVLLRSDALRDAIRQNPDLSWKLLAQLAGTIRSQNSCIESLATRDVSGRVALLMLRLAEQHGETWSGIGPRKSAQTGVRIKAKLTRAEIGTFVGATREHVTNIINEFVRLGYLTNDNDTGQLVVLKPADLLRRSQ